MLPTTIVELQKVELAYPSKNYQHAVYWETPKYIVKQEGYEIVGRLKGISRANPVYLTNSQASKLDKSAQDAFYNDEFNSDNDVIISKGIKEALHTQLKIIDSEQIHNPTIIKQAFIHLVGLAMPIALALAVVGIIINFILL